MVNEISEGMNYWQSWHGLGSSYMGEAYCVDSHQTMRFFSINLTYWLGQLGYLECWHLLHILGDLISGTSRHTLPQLKHFLWRTSFNLLPVKEKWHHHHATNNSTFNVHNYKAETQSWLSCQRNLENVYKRVDYRGNRGCSVEAFFGVRESSCSGTVSNLDHLSPI